MACHVSRLSSADRTPTSISGRDIGNRQYGCRCFFRMSDDSVSCGYGVSSMDRHSQSLHRFEQHAVTQLLVVSSLFPSSVHPKSRNFVLRRLLALRETCDVVVVNPIPWFPLQSLFARYRDLHLIRHADNSRHRGLSSTLFLYTLGSQRCCNALVQHSHTPSILTYSSLLAVRTD